MQRTWTTVAAEHNGTPEDRYRLSQAFDRLDWKEIGKDGLTLPMMAGEGIKEAIRQLRIPRVTHVAISNELAPYGLYGIRGHYTNGMAEVFIIDEGSRMQPLCSDFYPTTETATA